MSTIEEAITELMLADDPIFEMIKERLYPQVIPEEKARPACAYTLTETQHTSSRSGGSRLARSVVAFTCEAESYSSVKGLAAAVRDLWADVGLRNVFDMQIFGAMILNSADDYNETRQAHVQRVDVAIWHSENLILTQGART